MSIKKYYFQGPSGYATATYYYCDLDSEKPSSGLMKGDMCFTDDLNRLYVATASNALTQITNQSGGGPHTHVEADVTGLTASLTAKQAVSEKAQANGYASLGADGKVPSAQLPASSGSTPQFQLIVVANPITYTNAPAGGLEPAGQQSRVQSDLRNTVNVVGQCLFSVIPHAASGKLHFQYSTDGGSNWNTLLDMATGGYSANVLKVSAATAVPAGAKIVNALIRVIVHGDGVVDPVLQKACLFFQGA